MSELTRQCAQRGIVTGFRTKMAGQQTTTSHPYTID